MKFSTLADRGAASAPFSTPSSFLFAPSPNPDVEHANAYPFPTPTSSFPSSLANVPLAHDAARNSVVVVVSAPVVSRSLAFVSTPDSLVRPNMAEMLNDRSTRRSSRTRETRRARASTPSVSTMRNNPHSNRIAPSSPAVDASSSPDASRSTRGASAYVSRTCASMTLARASRRATDCDVAVPFAIRRRVMPSAPDALDRLREDAERVLSDVRDPSTLSRYGATHGATLDASDVRVVEKLFRTLAALDGDDWRKASAANGAEVYRRASADASTRAHQVLGVTETRATADEVFDFFSAASEFDRHFGILDDMFKGGDVLSFRLYDNMLGEESSSSNSNSSNAATLERTSGPGRKNCSRRIRFRARRNSANSSTGWRDRLRVRRGRRARRRRRRRMRWQRRRGRCPRR